MVRGSLAFVLTVLVLVLAFSPGSALPGPSSSSTDFDERIRTMMDAYGVPGLAVVVVRGEEILMAEGFGVTSAGEPYTEDTPVEAFSATKALSSFVYASLVEDGLLDLDAPLGSLLDNAPDAWAAIPFWRLLNHTSGLTTIIDKPEFAGIDADGSASNASIFEVVRDLPLDYAPGEQSSYRQTGYAVAELILEERLGKSWPELVREHLLDPAGTDATGSRAMMSGTRTEPLLASAGGLQTTAADMVKIFQALNAGHVADPEFIGTLLYRDTYTFDGYSLGSILDTIDGVRTVGHQGGGARATIRWVPTREVGVAVFTDATANLNLAADLADMLVREFAIGERTRMPIQVPLLGMLDQSGDAIASFYRQEAARSEPEYDFARAEAVLNGAGYTIMGQGRVADAISLFRLNVEEHPQSANAHDSLGEAYFEQGDLIRSLESYRRALVLAPDSDGAQRMIERLEASLEAAH